MPRARGRGGGCGDTAGGALESFGQGRDGPPGILLELMSLDPTVSVEIGCGILHEDVETFGLAKARFAQAPEQGVGQQSMLELGRLGRSLAPAGRQYVRGVGAMRQVVGLLVERSPCGCSIANVVEDCLCLASVDDDQALEGLNERELEMDRVITEHGGIARRARAPCPAPTGPRRTSAPGAIGLSGRSASCSSRQKTPRRRAACPATKTTTVSSGRPAHSASQLLELRVHGLKRDFLVEQHDRLRYGHPFEPLAPQELSDRPGVLVGVSKCLGFILADAQSQDMQPRGRLFVAIELDAIGQGIARAALSQDVKLPAAQGVDLVPPGGLA